MKIQDYYTALCAKFSQKNPGLPWPLVPVYDAYVALVYFIMVNIPIGTNIFDEDWDLLIVLDACRVDAIEEVSDEYEFLDTVDSITSLGSTSSEWMYFTFTEEHKDEVRNTSYISGNPFTKSILEDRESPIEKSRFSFVTNSHQIVPDSEFGYIDSLWKYEFDKSFNEVDARFTTEKTIEALNKYNNNRTIVHYMYPHTPFISTEEDADVYDIPRGNHSYDYIWGLYIENLRHVLDEIELLIENVDAEEVVITADHGEAFGEFGFYKHQMSCPVPSVRRVPWIETTAKDTGEYSPDADEYVIGEDTKVEERLQDLGYL